MLAATLGCTRKEAPALAPAAAPPPTAPAPVPTVRDAAPDVVDAASDAGDARPGGKKGVGTPGAGGTRGGGGLKVEGSLPRADGEKVVRGAQGKLRACFEATHPAGAGRKGRVSLELTVNDRGHVTVTEIPSVDAARRQRRRVVHGQRATRPAVPARQRRLVAQFSDELWPVTARGDRGA